MKISRINLLDSLKEENFHSSLILTYSFDQLFYESVVYKELRYGGSRNNIVLCDYSFYEQNVIENVSPSNLAGRFYSLLPIHTNSLFHPKIICLFGEKYISILIGSGNLGLTGYSLNDEIYCKIKFEVTDEKFHNFCSQIWTFINKYIRVLDGSFITKQIKAIESEYKWLSRNINETSLVNTSEDQIISFVSHQKKSILDQYIDYLRNEEINELIIVSPFFDEKCIALNELAKRTNAKKLIVIIQSNTVNLKYASIPKSSKINFYNWLTDSNKYLHAKIYIAKSKKHSHILAGSSNCSVSGLVGGSNGRDNIEACIYARVNKPNYFMDSLGLSDLISIENKITVKELMQVKFLNDNRISKKLSLKLIYLELKQGCFWAYMDNSDKSKKYSLVLNDGKTDYCVKLNSVSIKNNIITFKPKEIQIDHTLIGYIISEEGNQSNRVLVSNFKVLESNAPPPRASQFYEIIEKIDLENSDFIDLIAPFEKLIFYAPSRGKDFNFAKKGKGKEQNENNITEYVYISYDDFLNKTKKSSNKLEPHLLSQTGSIALLVEFLMSKIGIYKEGLELQGYKNDELDLKIYEEELEDEYLWTKPDDYYSNAKKEKIKRIDQSEARYYKSRLLKLGNTYITYLDQIIKGLPAQNMMPPKYLDSIELVKYFSISLLLNYFAGKEYKIGNEVIETIELDGAESKSYWHLALNIISRVFCYQDKTENHFNVLKKMQVDNNFDTIPEDFIAALSLAAFNICFIWEYFKDDEWKELEVLTYKFYINSKIYLDQIDDNKIKFYFDKYFDNSGFKEKRNPLTQRHIIQLSDIIKRFDTIKNRVLNFANKLDGIEKIFNEGKGHFPPIGFPCFVWNPRFGLSYAYEVSSPSVYIYEWGYSKEKFGFNSAFVLKVDIPS